jgi:hypothetical protein
MFNANTTFSLWFQHQQLTKYLPEYTEQDLEGFYSLLLSTSSSTNSMKNVRLISAPNVTKRLRSPRMRRMNNDEREEIVGDLMKRLNSGIVSTPHVGESTSDGIQLSIANPTQSLDSLQTSGFTTPRHDTLKALLNITKTLGEQGSDSLESNIPMVGVSRMEWTALIEDFVSFLEYQVRTGDCHSDLMDGCWCWCRLRMEKGRWRLGSWM